MSNRRGMALGVGSAVGGALLVLLAVTRDWYVVAASGIGTVETRMSGIDVRPGLAPLPWVALASPVALLALRGVGRAVVGLVLVATGALAAAVTLSWLEQFHAGPDHKPATWPVLCLVGAATVVLSGVLCVVRGRSWPALGSSYEAPASRRTEPVTDKAVWDALDRGDDPTA